jgi:putative phage-type endonuclease
VLAVTVRAARRIPDLEPGTDEWMRLMTASKVSAVLGLSPWESRFSLWHRMAGQLEAKPDTAATRRGHYLEDAIASWLGDQYPDLRFGRTGSWVSKARPWQSATPDRIARAGRKAVGVAEIKTAADYEEWGPDGSDQIPPHYRAQVVWQMDCLGLPAAYVAVLLPRLQFRGYVIRHDQGEADFIRGQVTAFLDSLPGGPAEQVPDIDDHDQTYVAVRQLHPDIEDREVEVPLPLATAYCDAVTGLRAAEDEHQLRRSELAQHMGAAKKAVVRTAPDVVHTIASRQAKAGGTPFVKAATKLPNLTEETSAA